MSVFCRDGREKCRITCKSNDNVTSCSKENSKPLPIEKNDGNILFNGEPRRRCGRVAAPTLGVPQKITL